MRNLVLQFSTGAFSAVLLTLSGDSAAAQQKKTSGDMTTKCRAEVRRVLPNYNDISQKAQAQRLFRTCMNNGGKL
ncbi:MAG TPA: hypothetical protein VNQ56_10245 [Pseudolabrys sp.]|nr:hypothetical protein [Pseudolabrys sp.]